MEALNGHGKILFFKTLFCRDNDYLRSSYLFCDLVKTNFVYRVIYVVEINLFSRENKIKYPPFSQDNKLILFSQGNEIN